ncbi:MAG: UDP-N-acetylglucosamine 2-epimerase (non-hydrolyzing) [Lutibacter sp.]|nr:UDP-N-acetylglucosamine 2-epimerase (non-hydrolyzing) [Lutibacter sp.]
MKILLCFGTRPEAIKMAPLYHALCQSALQQSQSELVEDKKSRFVVKVCVTAQHREMLDQVLDFFEMVPDYDLDVMQPNQTLNELSAQILSKMDTVFNDAKPDLVLVHGDTTTSTMVALAAFHKGIKVGHVEAGLRTYNKNSPFPEELNRQLTSRIADFHFAPTLKARQNLLAEGVKDTAIVITGNTVIDALFLTLRKIEAGYLLSLKDGLINKIDFSKKVILVTGHRRESFGTGFENLCKAILEIAKNKEVEIVYPVHLNPNVQKTVFAKLSGVANIHLIDPLDYPTFVWLMSKSSLIISDSGGIQEEAPSFNIPVLVTRETTERDEGIAAGHSFLVGTDPKKIVNITNKLLYSKRSLEQEPNPYGDGKACEKIVQFIKETFG